MLLVFDIPPSLSVVSPLFLSLTCRHTHTPTHPNIHTNTSTRLAHYDFVCLAHFLSFHPQTMNLNIVLAQQRCTLTDVMIRYLCEN